MRKKNKVISLFALVLCICMVFGNTMPVQAARKSSKNSGSRSNSAYQAVFDAEYYYNTYPDLQATLGNSTQKLFQHFVKYGLKEGRSGCADFNLAVYKANYADLRAAFGNNDAAYCNHYVNYGRSEGRNATTLMEGAVLDSTGADATQSAGAAGTVLASCTTTYNPAESRATNIATAASRINGIVLQPGDKFSFNKTILPRSTANGYVEAPIYVSGKHGTGIGGGICQVSSTLYSAMIDAGIPATERHTHSLPVYYVSEGRDATIAGNYYDLKFTNIFDYPILIQAVADGTNGSVTISIVQQ